MVKLLIVELSGNELEEDCVVIAEVERGRTS